MKGSNKFDIQQCTQDAIDEILTNGLPTLLVFKASWCPACRAYMPALEKIASHYDKSLNVVMVDETNCPNLIEDNEIQSYPTSFLYDSEGNPVEDLWKHEGGISFDKLVKAIENIIPEHNEEISKGWNCRQIYDEKDEEGNEVYAWECQGIFEEDEEDKDVIELEPEA